MAKTLNYRDEVKALLNAIGAPKLADLLKVTERGIMYWIAEDEPKMPRRDMRAKIHELFMKHQSGQGLIASEPSVEYDVPNGDGSLHKAISHLAESNKLLAESNKILATNSVEITSMVKKVTGGAPLQNHISFESTIGGLQELLIELGLHCGFWKNRDRASEAVHKELFSGLDQEKVTDIVRRMGKVSKGT